MSGAGVFRGLPKGSKLLVALSGGVDSAVAAQLCLKAGYEVCAATLKLFDAFHPEDARRVAEALGVQHAVIDLSADFESSVLKPSWEEYSRGRTPNPCALCNPSIKFGRLLEWALSQGCAGLATGHYARIEEASSGNASLMRAADRRKDQSYFLFGLSQGQLSRTCFPVGELTKEEVRRIAASLGLPNAERPESQDICFASDGKRLPERLREHFRACRPAEGPFIDSDGRRLGTHKGIYAYTIGQRKGMGVAMGVPGYVKSIDAASNSITLSAKPDELLSSGIVASSPNWILAEYSTMDSFDCEVQIRYRSKPVRAKVARMEDGSLMMSLSAPQRAVTPGQAAVFYQGDALIGGAWIDSAAN